MARYTILPPTQAPTEAPQPQVKPSSRYTVLKPEPTAAAAGPEPDISFGEANKAAAKNLIPSAIQYGRDFLGAVTDPVGTVKNITRLGLGAGQHVAGREGLPTEEMQMASALKKHYVDSYGSWEGFKRAYAADPAGVLADASAVLTGGGGAATRLPGMVGRAGRMVQRVGAAADPAALATAAPRMVGRRMARMQTGTGPDALNIATEAGRRSGLLPGPLRARGVEGEHLTQAMRRDAPANQAVEMGVDAMRSMRDDRHDAYITNIAQTRAATAPISMDPIIRRFNALDRSLRATMGRYKVDTGTQNVLNTVREELTAWYNHPGTHNAVALDDLKKRIQAIKYDVGSPEGRALSDQADRVIKEMSDAVKAEIIPRVPSYAKAMKEYEDASDRIREIERTMKLGERASTDTAARALTSAMRKTSTPTTACAPAWSTNWRSMRPASERRSPVRC